MKFAVHISRCEHILSKLESYLVGIAVTIILISGMAVVHSGLLMVE